MRMIRSTPITIVVGPAGTGKTRCAVDTGVALLREGVVRKIVVTRPTVGVEEDLGFLPGDLEAKMRPWMLPVYDALSGSSMRREDVEKLLRDGAVEVSPIAYMRGRTFDDAVIICDEAQNCSPAQLKMVVTRIGRNSRLVVTGDSSQSDLTTPNGLVDLLDRIDAVGLPEGVHVHSFSVADVKRHAVIKDVLKLYGG
jgi:phosphate starvation-inducible PhoH-like protein